MQAVPREVVEAETDHGAEEYDVYVHDAQPLAAGEEKHMLSVFVADEKGLINRVAGVFARRGSLRQPVLQKGCSVHFWAVISVVMIGLAVVFVWFMAHTEWHLCPDRGQHRVLGGRAEY